MNHHEAGTDDDKAGKPDPSELELERARELLARTVRFLSLCARDPRAAMESEDPHDLIHGLEALGAEPAPLKDAAEEPRTIPLRRRRSA